MSGETGLGIGTLLWVIFVAFVICAAIAGFFMWIGAKIARIETATFGRSMGAAVAAGFTSSIVTLILSLLVGPEIGGLVGILMAILVIKAVYATTFGQALIAWIGYLVSAFAAAWLSISLIGAGGARPLAAKTAMKSIRSGLDQYHAHAGAYPSTEQGLRALLAAPASDPKPKAWRGPYVIGGQTLLNDPWSRPYVYRGPTKERPSYELRSMGPDGKDVTGDDIEP